MLPSGPRADGDASLLAAGRSAGAQRVLGGTYRRVGDRLRIAARMLDVATGAVVAQTGVDGLAEVLFDLQDQVAAALLAARAPGPGQAIPSAAASRSAPAAPASSVERGSRGAGPGRAPGTRAAPPPAGAAGFRAPGVIDGPPPPLPPDVIRRDAQRRATIRAVEWPEGIRLDGQFDERAYFTVPAITGFIQQAPDEGAPATERTEAWILFDAQNLYVAARIWDSAPPSEWVANEMRRDTRQLRQNDTFAVILDTFYDRRNGVAFYTNPLGAVADFAITNEGNPNSDWNPVWDVRSGRFEGGWTVEMEIPFKSLRYRPGPAPVWGVQLRRNVRRKNEWAYITPLPISAGNGPGGIFRVSDAATLVGLDLPGGGRNLEIKPYAIGGVSSNLAASPPTRNAGSGTGGLDVKYGVTQNLTADFTWNTDFAQVEVDEQQVNLTRFSLFFPGEARVLPRGPRHLRLRPRRRRRRVRRRPAPQRAGGRVLRRRQRADPLLQPADRVCRTEPSCRSSEAGASPARSARSTSGR